ncbi:MAG: hypothetical protein ACRDJC_19145 [Thermomicrobiales bacterium]
MDGSRFDAWTRRRFGLAAAGLAPLLPWLAGPEVAAAKKNKKKKKRRCTKLGRECKPGGKRKCCQKLKCRLVQNVVGFAFHCCKDVGAQCGLDGECCSGFCLDDRCQPTFCKEIGQFCNSDENCCSNNCDVGDTDVCEP